MDKFLIALCEGDLKALIISGNPDPSVLEDVWMVILSEYQELNDETIDSIERIRLIKQIRRAKYNLFLLEQCILFLNIKYSQTVADSVNRLGYVFRPKEKEPEKYRPLLEEVIVRSRHKQFQIEGWIKELAELKTDDSRPKRETFEEALINIEELQHTAYSFETLTVSKFLALEKKLRRYVDRANRGINK